MAETQSGLDLSGYKTAAGAAKALYRFIRDELDAGDNVTIWRPEEAAPKRDGHASWTVCWEAGPYHWATHLTGGESIFSGEAWGTGNDPEVTGFSDQKEWVAEPYYSFDLQFSNY